MRQVSDQYIVDSYSLSPMQRSIVAHSLDRQLEGAYIDQLICEMTEPLELPEFDAAWQHLCVRHSVLRSAIDWDHHPLPVQNVYTHARIPITFHDWTQLPIAQQRTEMESFLQADRSRPFDLTRPPLTRVTIFQIAAARYQFVWTIHHAMLDGRSHSIVLTELFATYDALRTGQSPKLPSTRPYRDYIRWLDSQDHELAKAHWRHLLGTFSEPVRIVQHDQITTPSEERGCTEVFSHTLEPELVASLNALEAAHDITLNTLIQGAWALTLGCFSGADDIVFGSTRAARHSTIDGAATMVGLFINTLPVRVHIEDTEIIPWLQALRRQHLSARPFEHTDLTRIHECSNVPRGEALFETVLVFNNDRGLLHNPNSSSELRLPRPGLTSRLVSQTHLPLIVFVSAGDVVSITLEYDGNRFTSRLIAQILGTLHALLCEIASNSKRSIIDLPYMPVEELRQLMHVCHGPELRIPQNVSVHALFEAQTQKSPHDIAGIDGNMSITFAELDDRAEALAAYLTRLGVRRGHIVGLCVERSIMRLIGLLGILKSGAAILPLEPSLPAARMFGMIGDAEPIAIVSQSSLEDILQAYLGVLVNIENDRCVNTAGISLEKGTPNDPAYVIYTSGSTGIPKGVLVEHRALVNHCLAVCHAFELCAEDRVLQFASLSFDVLFEEVFPTWVAGGAVIINDKSSSLSLREFTSILEDHNVSVVNLPTPFWHEWLTDVAHEKTLPPKLRLVIVGSDALSRDMYTLWMQLFGDSVQWRNAYGVTEATITSVIFTPSRSTLGEWSPPAIGRPIANTYAFVLDRWQRPLPIGAPGELYIGGAGLAREYLKRPEVTADRFVMLGLDTRQQQRLYRTGDLVCYRQDGNLVFLGRADLQVKIHGYRVELGEVEVALRNEDGVREALVNVEQTASGDRHLVAYVESASPQHLSSEVLKKSLALTLPHYMIPARFVFIERIPRMSNGKLDRQAVASAFAESEIEVVSSSRRQRNLVDAALAELWQTILQVADVADDDDFFAIGGNSLQAVRFLAHVERRLASRLTARELYKLRTFGAIAEVVARQQYVGVPLEERVDEVDDVKATLPVGANQAYRLRQDEWVAERQAYSVSTNIVIAFDIEGPLNSNAMEASLNIILKRHEALRASFSKTGDGYRQSITPFCPLILQCTTMSELNEQCLSRRVEEIVATVANAVLPTVDGHMLSAHLVSQSAQRHVLIIATEHLVVDGWSMALLFGELGVTYAALMAGAPLPTNTGVSYHEYMLQRERVLHLHHDRLLHYWTKQLRGSRPAPGVNLSWLRTPATPPPYRGRAVSRELSDILIDQLRHCAREQRVTMASLFLAAFKVALYYHSRQSDIGVVCPTANRSLPGSEDVVGWLASSVTIRSLIDVRQTFAAFLQAVQQHMLEAHEHQLLSTHELIQILVSEEFGTHPKEPYVFFDVIQDGWQLSLADCGVTRYPIERQWASDNLSLWVDTTTRPVMLSVVYAEDLHEEVYIESLLSTYETILSNVSVMAEVSIMNIVAQAERIV